MQCPICKGKMELAKSFIKKDSVEFNAYKCVSCGEELMNSKQLRELSDKYRQLSRARDITFAKWGNSIAVRIPSAIAEKHHLTSGKHGLLMEDKDGIRIVPG